MLITGNRCLSRTLFHQSSPPPARATPLHPSQRHDAPQLRAFLRERLAPYMVPAVVQVLPELPTLTSGKVDRKRLPEPEQCLFEDDDGRWQRKRQVGIVTPVPSACPSSP